MPRITISGVAGRIDGVYDLDLADSFTGNELHLIKQHAGVRVGEISEAMEAGDYDLIVCLTKIAMDRSGNDVPIDQLMEAKVGAITFEQTDAEKADAEEDEELPPVSAPSGASKSSSEAPSSGPSSSDDSNSNPENGQPDTGIPDLLTGSGSSRETLAT